MVYTYHLTVRLLVLTLKNMEIVKDSFACLIFLFTQPNPELQCAVIYAVNPDWDTAVIQAQVRNLGEYG